MMFGAVFKLRFEGGPFDGCAGFAWEAPVRLYVKGFTDDVTLIASSRPCAGTEPYVLAEECGTDVRYVFEDLTCDSWTLLESDSVDERIKAGLRELVPGLLGRQQ